MDNRVTASALDAAPAARVLHLPTPDGGLEPFTARAHAAWEPHGRPAIERSRVFYAAPHVVAAADGGLDWDATLAFREHLWSQGLGVAEAMDTAQRGMGITWDDTRTLITTTAAQSAGRPLVAGVGTDQLTGTADAERVVDAYLEQLDLAQGSGVTAVIMASRHLAQVARRPEEYLSVYERILAASDGPVVLHWLGEAFDPQLRGYWGTADPAEAIEIVLELIGAHADKIDGIKISLLDARREVQLRAGLPAGVRMYTGDDYNFPELIAGDDERYSHALLGAFNPLASLAGVALDLFDAGEDDAARRALETGLPLSKKIFEAPTQYYKAGVAFVAWLGGHQDRFLMLDDLQDRRSVEHYAEVFRLAADAGVLPDIDLAAHRMTALLREAGVDA